MELIYEARGPFAEGTATTLVILLFSTVLTGVISFVVGLARLSGSRIIRGLSFVYVEFFRGIALLVQLFWLFFVLPLFGIYLEPITTAIIGLSLCNGAYGAEIVRGAILAVPRVQIEAATALNYSSYQRMRSIIIPQALPLMLPPFSNLTIELLKGTALVSLITIQDLAFQAQTLRQTTMKTLESFTAVLIIYFVIAMVISLIFKIGERSFSVGLRSGGNR